MSWTWSKQGKEKHLLATVLKQGQNLRDIPFARLEALKINKMH
jgi:hypothetical protein